MILFTQKENYIMSNETKMLSFMDTFYKVLVIT